MSEVVIESYLVAVSTALYVNVMQLLTSKAMRLHYDIAL